MLYPKEPSSIQLHGFKFYVSESLLCYLCLCCHWPRPCYFQFLFCYCMPSCCRLTPQVVRSPSGRAQSLVYQIHQKVSYEHISRPTVQRKEEICPHLPFNQSMYNSSKECNLLSAVGVCACAYNISSGNLINILTRNT